MKTSKFFFVAAAFLLLALWPLMAGQYGVDLVTKIMVFAIFALSLELLVGSTGLVCFGQAAFFGIGAYATVLLTPQDGAPSLLWLLPACVLAAAFYALLVGALSLRTKGVYFIMVTLAFAQMAYYVVHDTPLGGGTDGIYLMAKPVLGTLLAIGIELYRVHARGAMAALVYAPIILPDIVMAITTLALYVTIHLPLGRTSIVLAHIVFQTSFVALVVRGRLQGFPAGVIEAARDLGASQLQTLRRVILPLLAPGIVTAALIAFALSIDDFVITYFTAGAGASTLPLRIYSMVKRGVTPDVNALSTLLLLVTVAAVLAAGRVRRPARATEIIG